MPATPFLANGKLTWAGVLLASVLSALLLAGIATVVVFAIIGFDYITEHENGTGGGGGGRVSRQMLRDGSRPALILRGVVTFDVLLHPSPRTGRVFFMPLIRRVLLVITSTGADQGAMSTASYTPSGDFLVGQVTGTMKVDNNTIRYNNGSGGPDLDGDIQSTLDSMEFLLPSLVSETDYTAFACTGVALPADRPMPGGPSVQYGRPWNNTPAQLEHNLATAALTTASSGVLVFTGVGNPYKYAAVVTIDLASLACRLYVGGPDLYNYAASTDGVALLESSKAFASARSRLTGPLDLTTCSVNFTDCDTAPMSGGYGYLDPARGTFTLLALDIWEDTVGSPRGLVFAKPVAVLDQSAIMAVFA